MRNNQAAGEIVEIVEILKVTRTLKSQVEILNGLSLPEEKEKFIKRSLKEALKAVNAYCEEKDT